jgi:phosphohistidine phosphatase SixA
MRRARRNTVIAVVAVGILLAGCRDGRPSPPAPAAPPAPATRAGQPSDADLVARLRAGGQVIFIRHAATEATQDDPAVDLADRGTQRNLSPAGREQARRLGRAFSRLGIPVGAVLASPYARTMDTAELAFGPARVRATRELINEAYPGTDDGELARSLRRLLDQRPPAGQNTVLVSHGFNLERTTGLLVAEGESVVFVPQDGGHARLLTRIKVERWEALAEHG